MTWPGSAGQASYAFEDRSGRPIPGTTAQGPWALFRLLREVQTRRDPSGRLRVTFGAGGSAMHLSLEPASVRNPFDNSELAGFHCTD
jgi:type VI secretion system protein ImpL